MFFSRPSGGERTILLQLESLELGDQSDASEFVELARSAGADILDVFKASAARLSPRYLIGTGKLEALRTKVQAEQAELVIFSQSLTPGQERNLEQALGCRVLDRTGLILDIFAQRARSHEGKLQVELAQLEHLSTRLVRGWTHLERQKGGIGLRGPGETQLESDRRMLRVRIGQIRARLDKVRSQRNQARRGRRRAQMPSVSLVGYTNAGKSTLFNSLTTSEVYAADQLFATLDPTFRRLTLPDIGPVVLADTVGFIRHLPHQLVEAFRATLEETSNADLLLHVVDAQGPARQEQIEQVTEVLQEIGATEVPMLEVYNKIDLIDGMTPHVERDEQGQPQRVWVSARTGEGLALLEQAIGERLAKGVFHGILRLPQSLGRLRSRLFAMGAVRAEQYDEQGDTLLSVSLPEGELNRLVSNEGWLPQKFLSEYRLH